jgi:uncharacterized membrane protein
MKPKHLGIAIVILSIAIITLMLSFKLQYDRQQLKACAEACGQAGAESCTIASCPYHKGGTLSWIPLLVSSLVAGLGGIGIYLALSKDEKIITQKEYDLSGLSDNEKKAFGLVKEKKEGIYQSKIVEKLSLSKVKVTRILDKLEQHELIERKRRGMSNLIVVK